MTETRGVPGRSFEHKIPNPETRREIARRVPAGGDIAEIAALYGISTSTVRRYAETERNAQ